MPPRRKTTSSLLLPMLLLLSGGCTPGMLIGKEPPPTPPPKPTAPPAPYEANTLARSDSLVVYRVGEGEDLEELARHFLGDPGRAWEIAQFNEITQPAAGTELVIPLAHPNPTGVTPDGYRTVAILCYHQFGPGDSRMIVSEESFAAQLRYLQQNGYRVVSLQDLYSYLDGGKPLPDRPVVITIDDGYHSVYDVAYPLLKQYGYTATVFLYTEFIGGGDGLTWKQVGEMVASGVIDVQPHSEKHSNMGLAETGESREDYYARIASEIDVSLTRIREHVDTPQHAFAYPFGDVNQRVIDELKARDLRIGVTVKSGGNPSHAYPYLLRRTMIYGEDDLETFASKLHTFREVDLR